MTRSGFTAVRLIYGFLFITYACCQMFQFTILSKKMTWKNAQLYCHDKYDDLATFRSADDLSRVHLTEKTWIGLFDDPLSWKQVMTDHSNSWRWSLTGDTCPGGFQNWSSNTPKNYKGRRTCVFTRGGTWETDNCGTERLFACYSEESGSKHYTVETTPMSWDHALSHCRLYHQDLAMIEDWTENQALAGVLPNATVSVWIGLFREPWRWSDGSPSSFRYWTIGEPDNQRGTEQCTAALSSRRWIDIDCSRLLPAVCQQGLKMRLSVKVILQSKADLSKPDINVQLIELIGARLENLGTLKLAQFTERPDSRAHP